VTTFTQMSRMSVEFSVKVAALESRNGAC
jgi:hypothetical protein